MKNKNEQMIHNRNFIDACNNAINGIIYATTTQDNIKKQLELRKLQKKGLMQRLLTGKVRV